VSARFDIEGTPIPGVRVARRRSLGDDRGFLERMYCREELQAHGFEDREIAQINRTVTRSMGTLRGLHFQRPPHAETKMIACLAGSVFDVAVDLRAGSPSFGTWFGVELTPDNALSLVIPEGVAHGFQTLTDDVMMLYFHSAPFVPEADDGVDALDPVIGVHWPLPVGLRSERDLALPNLADGFEAIHA